MLEELKDKVWKANLDLVRFGLVTLTFGNVSGFDPGQGLVAIKPSGVPYEGLRAEDMVLVDVDGRVVEGNLRPSSDLPTHLSLYRAFRGIGGVAHCHSDWAAAFAQARREIPCLGTTHADCLQCPVPLTRHLTPAEVREDYEGNTGAVIVERFARLDPVHVPVVLVAGHGPFAWGATPAEAAAHSLALEKIAKVAWLALGLNPKLRSLPGHLIRKHFERKHGPRAYYGQKDSPAPKKD
jgi:L-ribulose-5-phosphate 4-epimerase